MKKYLLYIDESGSRRPAKVVTENHRDCPWFAMGGVLLKEEDKDKIKNSILDLQKKWPEMKQAPLHSTEIRCKKDGFTFLKDEEKCAVFLSDLNNLIEDAPIKVFACVLNKNAFEDKYGDLNERWLLCKTAFSICVERAVKWSLNNGRKLEVFVERASKADDDRIKGYREQLINTGLDFDYQKSKMYNPLSAQDFKNNFIDLKFKTKSSLVMQLADLCLWPVCDVKKHPQNRSYSLLENKNKIITSNDTMQYQWKECGIKYSCY